MKLILRLSRATVLGVFLLASASLQADIFHGTVEVIQNDDSNNTSSVTLSLSGATSPGASIGAASNRGDYIIELPPGQGAAAGIMIPTVAENGRNNSNGGDPNGTFFPTSAVDITNNAFNNGSEGYFLALSRSVPSANSTEFNVNTAFAYFPYDQFLGGLARPGTQTLVGSEGLNYGDEFTEIEELGPGAYLLDLGPGASSQDGILLATSAINEDNFALTESFGDGTFAIYNQDNGTAAGSNPEYEEDPVGFVYLPASSAGSDGIIALGRINSDGTSAVSGGTFTVTRTGTGTYLLEIPGHTNETGTLIVTGAGGVFFNIDNAVSYEWAPQQNGWVIQSRDLPNYTLQDPTGASTVEAFFSFAFLSRLLVVDTLEDELDPIATDGTGISLREAIRDSEGRAIVFAPELSGGTITLDQGQLVIPSGQNISINAGTTGITIDANQQSRVMEIEPNATVALHGLTLTGGRTNDGSGGGGGGFGGGIFASNSSSLTLSACTITGNQTGNGGRGGGDGDGDGDGGFGGNGFGDGGDGVGGRDGGLFFFTSTTVTINRSIIAGNSGREGSEQISGTIDAGAGNLTSDDPLLAPLGDYGGPTLTMPPLPGSPAIDAADSNNPGGTDQRGFPRFIGSALDVGAVELQGTADPTLQLDSDSDGSSNGVELAIGTDPFVADPSDVRNLSLVNFTSNGSPQFTFGVVNEQQSNIILRLTRSTDLIIFDEVVASNEGPRFNLFLGAILVNDPNPPADGRAFYRLEAELR